MDGQLSPPCHLLEARYPPRCLTQELCEAVAIGNSREAGGGANCGQTPGGMGKGGRGGSDDVISGVRGVYKRGARVPLLQCPSPVGKGGGRADRRTHTETLRPPSPRLRRRGRPERPVQPPLAPVRAAPGPRPPAARRPGFAMRSAAVLALLLCAGQGERARGLGGEGPGRPCLLLPCLP